MEPDLLSRLASLLRRPAVLGLVATGLTLSTLNPASGVQALNQAAAGEKVIRYIRQRFNIPDSVKLTVSDFRETVYPDFYETTLTLDDGKEKRTQSFFVSKDGRYLVEGNIFALAGDPRKDIVRLMSLANQPAQGPATAPVTIVEYSDLECPSCAQFHHMLETEIIPKYGNRIRVVFKEFPLVNIHDWSLTAAIASQCTYQIDPSKFVPFRSLVFQRQETLDADHIRDLLLHLAAEVGIDNMKLASCIDSKASLARVEASMQEGQTLGISQTSTSFINGRILVGAPSLADVDKLIEEGLHDSK
jgi:protein-disulfide isomerase